jgi:hypothetical protein
MDRSNWLVALAIALAVFAAGVWIGRHWMPLHAMEVVEGLAVEKLCRVWTDDCNYYARGSKGYFATALYCPRPKRYTCLAHVWW